MFESIHPFRDGNGRTGRILLNYLAISRGWPPIIIKGEQEADRQRYYAALEAGDAGFHHGFPPPPELYERLEQGNFTAMQNLLADGVVPQLDLLLVKLAQEQEPLRPLADLAAHLGVQEATLRQWVSRGQLIAVKQGRKLYSAPSLFLRLTG
ncbi:Fic family protein [Deinococcus sp. PESE-13]